METSQERIVKLEMRVKALEHIAPDVEARLRKIERNMYMISGAFFLLQLILKFAHL